MGGESNPFLASGDKGVGAGKRSVEDFYQLVQQQSVQVQQQTVSLNKCENDFAEQKLLINGFANQLKNIAELQSTTAGQSLQAVNKASKNSIASEKMKQQLLKNYIDFSGIPYVKDESITDIISLISIKIGLAISASDISSCYRIGQSTGVNVKGEPLPQVIVVEFLREITKISVINSMKNLGKDLTTTDIGFKDSPSRKIHINERLTPYFRDVKREALKFKSNKGLKFVWTNGGVVHGRVDLATSILSFHSIEDIHCKLSINPHGPMDTGLDINPGKSRLRSAATANASTIHSLQE